MVKINSVFRNEIEGCGSCGSGFYEAIELAKNGLDDEFKNMDKKEFIKYVGTICYIEPRCQDIYIIKRNRILSFKNDVKKLKEN